MHPVPDAIGIGLGGKSRLPTFQPAHLACDFADCDGAISCSQRVAGGGRDFVLLCAVFGDDDLRRDAGFFQRSKVSPSKGFSSSQSLIREDMRGCHLRVQYLELLFEGGNDAQTGRRLEIEESCLEL